MLQIENYPIIPNNKCKNLSQNIFGDYIALYRTTPPSNSNSKQAHWLCQCNKCKKYIVKSAHALQNGVNECDCKYDLTGQKFGRWTVLSLSDKKTKNRGRIWQCKCECGTIKEVPAETLKKGESQSCGCYQKEVIAEIGRKTRIDLTGQRFGKLVALYPIYSIEKDTHTKWMCQCDCGNMCEIDMGNLKQGFSQSCGCTHSKQEENIIKLLTTNNLQFKYQYTFNEMLSKKFDFYVNNCYIIEFDGSQHFYYTNRGWDTEEHYKRTHQSDLEKNKYCFDHGIPIIRIPYDTEYNLLDLKLESTRFLLTPENEQEYYNKRSK